MKKIITVFCLFLIYAKAFSINPSRTYQILPKSLGLSAQVIKIPVNDKIKLHSWIITQKDLKKPFIILSNSDAGNMANCLAQAQAFFKAGYNVVLYDYRGFGESADFEINRDMMYYDEFAEDLKATISFVKERYKTNAIVLYGTSMGSIISDLVIQHDKSIKGAIFDSFPIDPKLVSKRILEIKNKTVLLPDGVNKYVELNSKKLGIPVLLFSGLQDMVTKSTDYDEFLTINTGSKLVTWDCNHLQSFYTMTKITSGDLYMAEVNSYISSLKF